jgi:hypothetical protein
VLKLSRGDVKTAKRAARQFDPETLPVIEEGEKVISATATLRCLLQGGLRAAFRDRGEKAWSSYRKEKKNNLRCKIFTPAKPWNYLCSNRFRHWLAPQEWDTKGKLAGALRRRQGKLDG